MITFNNKNFILLSDKSKYKDHEYVGFYRPYKKSISLFNKNKEKIGAVTKNKVLLSALKVEGGYWYSFATIGLIGEYSSYRQECEDIEKALEKLK